MKVSGRSLRAACRALAVGGLLAAVVQAKQAPVVQAPGIAGGDAAGAPVLAEGTAHDALFGIAFDGDHGLAVGAMGQVQASSDGGRTWKRQALKSTPLALLGVGVSGERQVAVGQQGLILLGDGKGAWTRVDGGTDQRLLAVGLNRAGLVAAVGAFGTITVSQDAGKSWSRSAIDWSQFAKDGIEPHLYDVIVSDSGVITVAGEGALILRSGDQGRSWVVVNKGEASLFDLSIHADGVGFAVGQDGFVLTTHDGGNVWTPVVTGSRSVLLGVWSAPDGHVVIAGMHQTLESRDGGQSWASRSDGDFATGWYSGVAASGSGGLILVGNRGRIVKLDS